MFCFLTPCLGKAAQQENDTQQNKQPSFISTAFPEYHADQLRYFKKALAHPDVEVRKQAIEQIHDLDHHQVVSSLLIESLAEALKHSETREPAAILLGQLGQPAIPAFVPLLDSDQQAVRVRAALAVLSILSGKSPRLMKGYLAKAQQRAMEVMLTVLADPQAPEWPEVARAAKHIPRMERYRAVALLLEALHEVSHRRSAARALAWMDLHGWPALVVAVNAEDEAIRVEAMKALAHYLTPEELGEEPLRAVIPVFEQGEKDSSQEVSRLATRALTQAKSELIKRQRDAECQKNPQTKDARQLGHRALLQFVGIESADPKTAIPKLAERVFAEEDAGEEQRLMRHSAAQALAVFGKPARPHLLKGLKHESPFIRSITIEAIRDHQPDFQEAIPLLIEALQSEEKRVRDDAARALAKMNPTDQKLLEQLEKALDEDSRGVPQALAQFGPVIAPRLLERIQNPDDSGAEAAVRAFAQLEQPPDEEVIKRLIDLMGSENEKVLHRARRSLEGGWSFTRPYVLEALKEHQNPQVRQFAAQILRFGKLGHTWNRSPVTLAAPDVPVLLAALNDKDRNVRIGAAQSLAIVAPGVARWSPEVRKMVPELADAAIDDQLVHGLQPMIPLQVLGDHATEAIPQMVKSLRTHPPHGAYMFLRERGAAAVPALRDALQSDDQSSQSRAIDVLRNIGPAAKPAAKELIPLAKQGELDHRLLAARALATIGADPGVALQTVQDVLENRRQVSFWEDRVLDTLVQLVDDHRPAVSELVPLLTGTRIDQESNREIWYVEPIHLVILGRTAPNVPEMIKALQQVALGHHNGGREAAFVALQKINPEAAAEIAPEYYRELAKQKAEKRNR